MSLPPSFLDDLRTRLPVSDIVGQRVRLTKAGREHKGLCPFHKEKTPSFTVNDDKGFFHCFGCGAHGDIIGFVMQHDRLGFMEAVEQLAAQAGMQVPEQSPEASAVAERRKGLHELVEGACKFFQGRLSDDVGAQARDYLTRRGIDKEAAAEFRLGYAPANSRALIDHLAAAGFDEHAIETVGLMRRPDDGRAPYTFFRNRLIFPVTDRRDRVIAFGARLLEGDGPKYINSPDSPIFHKGQSLYNVAKARLAAGRGHGIIVAEGYMDVIALVRAGFAGAVAPLGTAVTEEQIGLLWRMTKSPVLCFDGDEAGRRAAWRAVERLLPKLQPDKTARIAFLPDGEDPDSLLARQGRQGMKDVLGGALGVADLVWRQELTAHALDTPEGRAGLRSGLEAYANRIEDQSVRQFYRQDFQNRIDQAFPWRGGGNRNRFDRRMQATPGARPRRPRSAIVNRAAMLLATVVNHPALFSDIEEDLAMIEIADRALDAMRRDIVSSLSADPALDSDGLRAHLTAHGHQPVLAQLLSAKVMEAVPFARRSASLDDARRGWLAIVAFRDEERVLDELRRARGDLARNATPQNQERVKQLEAQVKRASIDLDGAG
ncbi:MAG: DNA primase [Pseudomonadota bacterium]